MLLRIDTNLPLAVAHQPQHTVRNVALGHILLGEPTAKSRIQNGVIDFSSGVGNQLVVLEYVSDGMANGNEADVVVHKFAEEYMYRYLRFAILNTKANVNQYERQLSKKEKEAELRNAKIRLKGIHPSRLLMSLRGQGKIIK